MVGRGTAMLLRDAYLLRRGSVLVRCPACSLFSYERFSDEPFWSGPCARCGKLGKFFPADSELLAPGGVMTECFK